MNLSPLADLVVCSLLHRVRVLADCQLNQLVSDLGWDCSVRNEMRSLTRRGWIKEFRFETKSLQLEQPLATWIPEESPTPNFGQLSWLSQSRYQKTKTRCHLIYTATDLAERRFGGIGGKLRQPNQLMHDLGTAATYVAKLIGDVDETQGWTSEDMLRRRFRHLHIRKIPDAALIFNGQISKAIEFAGRDYCRKYLLNFHCFWKSRNTPYEIW